MKTFVSIFLSGAVSTAHRSGPQTLLVHLGSIVALSVKSYKLRRCVVRGALELSTLAPRRGRAEWRPRSGTRTSRGCCRVLWGEERAQSNPPCLLQSSCCSRVHTSGTTAGTVGEDLHTVAVLLGLGQVLNDLDLTIALAVELYQCSMLAFRDALIG